VRASTFPPLHLLHEEFREDLFVGDTWKIHPKLSLNYGLRWDVSKPDVEKFNHLSAFDPLWRIRRRETSWGPWHSRYGSGAASLGRGALSTLGEGIRTAPGYCLHLSSKTVVRSGYGIFYTNMFYPGWEVANRWTVQCYPSFPVPKRPDIGI